MLYSRNSNVKPVFIHGIQTISGTLYPARDVLCTRVEPYRTPPARTSSIYTDIHALRRPRRSLCWRRAISYPSAPATARTSSLYADIHALRRPRRPLYRRRAISYPSAPATAHTSTLYADIHALRRPRRPLCRRRAISHPSALPRRVSPLYMSAKAGYRACGLQWSLRGVNVGRRWLLRRVVYSGGAVSRAVMRRSRV